MALIGYFASLLVGVSLGLLGGGGSVLTMPVLVYLFGLHPALATSYSLFVVGSTSFVGAITNYRKGLVNIKAALFFAASSIITVFVVRKFLVPVIPENIITVYGFTITSPLLTMLLFALLMLLSAIRMIKRRATKESENECVACIRFTRLAGYGIGTGVITGLLGGGSGFLLIPALVLLLKMPMKRAVGTSLLVIAFNSLTGFAGDLGHVEIDWRFLFIISGLAIAGVIIGGLLAKKIESSKLKKGFGWFMLSMSVYIVIKEIFLR